MTERRRITKDQSASKEMASRIIEAREALGITQTEFARQVSISRDRLASYEDGRSILRCDVALRLCRQFFISEFWLACGSVTESELADKKKASFAKRLTARSTMALAVDESSLACPPGCSFGDGFDEYLRQVYWKLNRAQHGFPRIAPLPSDGPEYFTNALNCAVEFWRLGLSTDQWRTFFAHIIVQGHSTHRQILSGKLPVLEARDLTPSWLNGS